jgi:PAS domain S-box-containing protein
VVAREQERHRDSQRQTAESLTLLETLLSSAPIGIGFVDRDFRIRQINKRLGELTDVPREDQLGRTIAEVMPELWAQVEPVCCGVLDTGAAVVDRETVGVARSDPGREHHWLASFYPVSLDEEIIGIGLVVVDVTARREAETLHSAVVENMVEGLVTMDGDDRLTSMNPAAARMLGWSASDLIGKPIHAALHAQRPDGWPCDEDDCELLNLSAGTEAVVVRDDVFTRADGAPLSVAYSVAPLLSGPTATGGVVVFRDASEEQAGRARVTRELEELSWVGRTRDAIEEDRLVLYAQPIVPLVDGPPREELLLRMIEDDGQTVPPGKFLPAAEKYGVIREIDRWVASQGIRLAAGGRRVQLNLSGDSIGSPEMLALIERELHDTGADPTMIVFEITETALMRDTKAAETFTHYLVTLGCSLALDDFGTGFGSFTYLKTLPVEYLKLDVEFVRNLGSSRANQHLVKAVVNLAQGFSKKTIAEGVEDEWTVELLREYGVDFAQGYHLGRPARVLV